MANQFVKIQILVFIQVVINNYICIMEVVERKIKDLIKAEYNPRELTKDQENQLKDSLKRFGIVDPVIVNVNKERKNIIIGGHQRTKVWEMLGNKTIPTIELDLTLEKEKELNVRLNKNTGQFDMDLLQEHFNTDDLIEWGFDEKDLIEKEIDELEEGEDIKIEKSLQVLPKKEYIIIIADEDSDEWEELKTIFSCGLVRQGGCKIGSTSDKATTGLERVFDLKTFKQRVGI